MKRLLRMAASVGMVLGAANLGRAESVTGVPAPSGDSEYAFGFSGGSSATLFLSLAGGQGAQLSTSGQGW